MNLSILHRDDLPQGGFAGLKEKQLVRNPEVFGPSNGAWQGIGNFVYLADANFLPSGETHMHDHMEVDVISIMIDGRLNHEGSLESGTMLTGSDVQVQRAGGEGFSHNEVNPDDKENRMLQLWVLPETKGEKAAYRVYKPKWGGITHVYGSAQCKSDSHNIGVFGNECDDDADTFKSQTNIDVALLRSNESINLDGRHLTYVAKGDGVCNDQVVKEGDLIDNEASDGLYFKAGTDCELVIISAPA